MSAAVGSGLEVCIVITLGDVLFATGRAELTGSAPEGLRKLASFLEEYPDRSIAIEGHTDSVGTDQFNMSLSQRRADAVQSFLVDRVSTPLACAQLARAKVRPLPATMVTPGASRIAGSR